jgi:hypothetical protein
VSHWSEDYDRGAAAARSGQGLDACPWTEPGPKGPRLTLGDTSEGRRGAAWYTGWISVPEAERRGQPGLFGGAQ